MEFLGYDISGIILIVKILAAVLSVGFLIGTLISFVSFLGVLDVEKKRRETYFDREESEESPMEKRWNAIRAHFQSQNPAEWRMAIIDADAMLEDLITSMGYHGDTFGEKLKSIRPGSLAFLDAAWHVHKLRNVLAHEGTGYHLSDREAYQAYKTYENIFYSTGYIT